MTCKYGDDPNHFTNSNYDLIANCASLGEPSQQYPQAGASWQWCELGSDVWWVLAFIQRKERDILPTNQQLNLEGHLPFLPWSWKWNIAFIFKETHLRGTYFPLLDECGRKRNVCHRSCFLAGSASGWQCLLWFHNVVRATCCGNFPRGPLFWVEEGVIW